VAVVAHRLLEAMLVTVLAEMVVQALLRQYLALL
jgi:hypothetical protein